MKLGFVASIVLLSTISTTVFASSEPTCKVDASVAGQGLVSTVMSETRNQVRIFFSHVSENGLKFEVSTNADLSSAMIIVSQGGDVVSMTAGGKSTGPLSNLMNYYKNGNDVYIVTCKLTK